jgi:hypothetical protein
MVVYNAAGHKLYLGNPYPNSDTVPRGVWDCSGAIFNALSASNSEYATQSWVNSRGFMTGTSGATGYFETPDGKTIFVSNGLITGIVNPA